MKIDNNIDKLFNTNSPFWTCVIDFEQLKNEGRKTDEQIICTGEKVYSITKGDTSGDFIHHVSSPDDILYTIRTTGGVAIIFYDLYSDIETIGSIIEIPDSMIEDIKGCVFNIFEIYKEKTSYFLKFKDLRNNFSLLYKLYCHSKPETEEGMISRVGCKVLQLSEDKTKYIEMASTDLHGKENYEINKLEFL